MCALGSRSYTATRCQGARACGRGVIPLAGRSPFVRVPLPVPLTPARTSGPPSILTGAVRARTSVPLAAGQQLAGADRFQRGETRAIFMRFMLSLLVLSLLAAAHLGRWHGCGCAPVKLISRMCRYPDALAPQLRAHLLGVDHQVRAGLPFTSLICAEGRVLAGSTSSRLLVAARLSVCR